MKTYYKYIIPLFLGILQNYYSQSNNNSAFPKIIPPSQETFANSKVSFEPSSNGNFSYQYPIYQIDNNIKLPILLNYSSDVRVDDIGGSTGISWQLNAGGVISRVVKDETDENVENWRPITINENSDVQKIKRAADASNKVDTEYDWFNFSISNGISGSFYIDKDLNVFIESKDKIKIEITDKTESLGIFGRLLEFKLTDKYGNEYYFGGIDKNIEKTTYEYDGPDQHATTGWYLYKIITTQKNEISLNYLTEDISYYASLNASFNVQDGCPGESFGSTYSDIIKSQSTIKSLRPMLKEIAYNDTQILFTYNKPRYDLFTNTTNNLLTSIDIKFKNKTVENFNLDYFDIKNNSMPATYYGLASDENTTRNRHFLKSILHSNKNAKTDFEYYNLESIPPRFSLNTDYYGYSNGAYNNSPFPMSADNNNFGIFKSLPVPSSVLSANKEVNPSLTSIGNLKKIIHSTKGYSEVIYEPNSSFELVNKKVKEEKRLTANYNRCDKANHKPSDAFTFISNGDFIEYYGTASFDYGSNCGEPDSLHDIHSLIVTDISTGEIVFSDNNQVSEPFKGELNSNYYPISTENGHTYKVEYSVSSRFGATRGSISFKYNEHTITNSENIFYGGSRVSQIRESDTNGREHVRKFYYNNIDNIASKKTSITNNTNTLIFAQQEETSKLCSTGGSMPMTSILKVYRAYKDNIIAMYNHRNNKIFYTDITEIIEGHSAIERNYSYFKNTNPYIGRTPIIYNIPSTNSGELKSNLLFAETVYKYDNGQYNPIKKIDYQYNFSKIKALKSYVFRENFKYLPNPTEDQLLNISYGFYENYYGFYNPTKIETTEYYSNNIVLTKTDLLSYENLNHSQLIKQNSYNIDKTITETTYQYAHEKGNQYLIDKNMIGIPLQTTVTQKQNDNDPGKTISKSEILYPTSQADANAKTAGLALPVSVLGFDLQNPDDAAKAQTEITYDLYDNKGNILQYSVKGKPVTVVWGYGQTQPIAK
ncbi:hypothetical protein, partial [Elizabethkingia anophelis]|uniref:hypothetical protein n=2 Tax=Elizabethkingia anophelis TaxID=1117645 RepID=UPI000DFA251A